MNPQIPETAADAVFNIGYDNIVNNWQTSLISLRNHVLANRNQGATSRYDIINFEYANMSIAPKGQ